MAYTENTTRPNLFIKIMILTAAVLVITAIFIGWDSAVSSTVEWQKNLHTMLASHIRSVSEDVFNYGGALITLSFGYGVFHAVGPGHGKAVIVTYLGTNKESAWKGIFISFAAALLQSIIAIALVSTVAQLLKFKLTDAHNYGNDIALVSYILVMMLGFTLALSAIRRMMKQQKHKKSFELDSKHSHQNRAHDDARHEAHHSQSEESENTHVHTSDCGCSHTHVPVRNESIWQTIGIIFSMGLRPCSGAIVVLIYAHLVGVYTYGVTATLMMGIGTGLSISLIAIITIYARSWLERFFPFSDEHGAWHYQKTTGILIRGLGGVMLIILGWSLFSAASALSSGHPLF